MEPASLADAYDRALQAERARNGRQFAFFRFTAIGVVFIVNLAFLLWRSSYTGAAVVPLAIYWAAAAAVFWARQRSDRDSSWGALAVPLIDIPVVYFLLSNLVARLHEQGFDTDAVAVATQMPLFYLLFVLAGSAFLEARYTWLATAIAILLQSVLLWREQRDVSFIVMVGLATLFATALSLTARRRSVALIRHAALEQARRERLGRYFSPQVADTVGDLERGIGRGQTKVVSILFADLRDFTALAEHLSGEEVVRVLNDFHARMVDRVFADNGTLDKYLGDGLMAYFGAPVPQLDHAARAVHCALEMQAALAAMNRARELRGEPALRMGVGVHTGPVVLGDIGAERRREYTAIGDTVNVAARIEQLTKSTDAPILVSESTRALVPDGSVRFVPMEPMPVRGKTTPLQLYRVESTSAG
jgi:adenylate cyclase